MDKLIEFILMLCDDDVYYVLALIYALTMAFSMAFIVAYYT